MHLREALGIVERVGRVRDGFPTERGLEPDAGNRVHRVKEADLAAPNGDGRADAAASVGEEAPQDMLIDAGERGICGVRGEGRSEVVKGV